MKYGPAAPLLIFLIDGIHIRAVKMTPLQGPEGVFRVLLRSPAGFLFSGRRAVSARFMAVRLPAVNEYTVSRPKLMNSAPIDQPSKAGKDGKKQTGMKSRPFALMGLQSLQSSRFLQMEQTGARKSGRRIYDTAGTYRICIVVTE